MNLRFDPGDEVRFWHTVSQIPGFPKGEHIRLQRMLFEPGAIFQLSDILYSIGADPQQPLLVVMDATLMHRGRDEVKGLVIRTLHEVGWPIQPLILQPDSTGQVHTEMNRIHAIQKRLQPGSSLLSIGSGVVTDITKHAAHLFEEENQTRVPYVAYQTANSVSAFTSNMAPVFIDGVKRTLPSRYPDALVCDLETLCDAPAEMTLAGVGDILAVFSSLADWRLAHILGMDPDFSPLPQTLLGPLDGILLHFAVEIRERSMVGMEILAKLIALGGLAMSLTHATTPLSGFEHVISHLLDLIHETQRKPLAMHGSQVALATRLTCAAYQTFIKEFNPQQVNIRDCYPSHSKMKQHLRRAFDRLDSSGKAGEECWKDYQQKLEAWQQNQPNLQYFLENWDSIRGEIRELTRTPAELLNILHAINAPQRFDQLQPPLSEEEAFFAFQYAPFIRKRLTLGDLFIFFQWPMDKLWNQIWPTS